MSASIEAALRLDIADLQEKLARSSGDVVKWKSKLEEAGSRGSRSIDGIGRSVERLQSGKAGRGMALGGIALQVQDIAVQAQMGAKMSMILAQQVPQMLGAFGASGMVLGGVVALGGALWTVGDSAKSAFAASIAGADGFNDSMKRLVAGGSFQELAAGLIDLRRFEQSIESMKPARGMVLLGQLMGGPSEEQIGIEAGRQEDLANRRRADLEKRLVASANDQAHIAELRAAGRADEADELERQLTLTRQIASVYEMEVDPSVKRKLAASMAETSEAGRQLKIYQLQQSIAQQQASFEFGKLDAAGQIQSLQGDMVKLSQEESRLRDENRLDELAMLDLQSRRLNISQQLFQLETKRVQESTRLAEQQKTAAQSALDEYNLLKAKGTRGKGDDYKVEREIAIRRRREQLMREIPSMSEADANAMSTEMRDMEERQANGGRAPRMRHTGRHIKMGSEGGGGLDQHFRDQQSPSQWETMQRGPSKWQALQQSPFAWGKSMESGASGAASRAASRQDGKTSGPIDLLLNLTREQTEILKKGLLGS